MAFIQHRNATRAYTETLGDPRAAISSRWHRVRACEMRHAPRVAKAILEIEALIIERWSKEHIEDRLARAAGGDVTDLLDAGGSFDLEKARDLRILKRLRTRTRTDKDGTTVETDVEIHDPIGAAMDLARLQGLTSPKQVEHGVTKDAARALAAAIAAVDRKQGK